MVASSKETIEVIPVLGFCTLKRFDLADRLLASIDYPIEHLVVVDNSGLQTWTPTKPDCVGKLWTIRVPFGLGLVGAWNLIVKSTPYAPYWVLVNDDAWFEAGSLEKIANEDNHDFLADTAANPRGTLTRRGNCAINCFIMVYQQTYFLV